MIGKRYSVPIHGKYLVIIANPVKHPMHVQFPVPLSCRRTCSATAQPIMSALWDLTGGHFSA
jgi:hypothetical protein